MRGRIPRLAEPNAWSRALMERRSAGVRLLDLTEANPTQVGLGGAGPRELASLATPDSARYVPDPRGLPSARQAVSGYYADRGLAVSAEHLILTSGTSEAYAHLFRLLCEPEEEVLVPQPSYPLFGPIAALEAVTLGTYRLDWHGRWRADLDSLERAIRPESRAVVVVQPNHPTGSCLAREERLALEELCARHDLALISDEVFGDFPRLDEASRSLHGGEAREGAEWVAHRGLPSLLSEARVLTFVLSGLSKVCGMPQLKLSWIAVSGPAEERDEALRGLEWIADLFLSVAAPVQNALPRLLEARHAFQARVRERIGANQARLRELCASQPELEVLEAEGGWVAVLRMPSRRSDEEWALELLRRDVVVHPGHFYDFAEPWYLVVSLIVEAEVFAEALSRIEDALKAPVC